MEQIEVGQAWAIQAHAQVPPLLVVIGRIEELRGSKVASVSITTYPASEYDGWPGASHLPIALDSLGLEQAKLVRSDTVIGADFEDGYSLWMKAYRNGKAGIFTLSAQDAYAAIVDVAQQSNK